MAEELCVCPNCGGKNLLQASRCVHCGLELEEFFHIEDQIEADSPLVLNPEDEDGLPELLRDLQKPDLGGVFGQNAETEAVRPIIKNSEQESPQMPDWLSRVRERAKVEDPKGELVKKVSTADEVTDESKRVAQEFDAWIARLQESARREAMLKAKGKKPDESSEDGVPKWFQRVRELQPRPDEQTPEDPPLTNSGEFTEIEKWDSGWSEEDLEKLRRGEYLDPEGPVKPLGEPETEMANPVEQEETSFEPDNEGTNDLDIEKNKPVVEPGVEHQISELEDDNETLTPPLFPVEEFESEAKDRLTTDERMGSEEEISLSAIDTSEQNDSIGKPVIEGSSEDLLLLKSQNERVKLLLNLVAQEGKVSVVRRLIQPQRSNWSYILLPLLLLVGIIGAILLGSSAWPRSNATKAANVAFVEAIESVEPGDATLVVFDYQAATSAEIEIGASKMLRLLIERNADLTLQTTQSADLWLLDGLRKKPGFSSLPKVNFIPGGNLGMLKQILYFPISSADAQALAQNSLELTSLLSYSRILVISDSSASIRDWIEQINPWLPGGTLLFLTSHQEVVTLSAYYDSGQIGGYVAGLNEFNALDRNATPYDESLTSYRAYQVGLLVMIMLILLGMVLKADQDSDRQVEQGVVE